MITTSLRHLRRWLLKKLVPEAVWPVDIQLTGVRIPVRGQPFSFGVKRALCNGTYEYPERTLLAEVLRPRMTVIELGSSLGVVSAVAAEAVGREGKVVCVEAAADLAHKAGAWLKPRYPHVSIVHGYGFPTLRVPADLSVAGFENHGISLGGRVEFGRAQAHSTPNAHSLVFDLGSVMEKCDVNAPDVLVCDIEGSELVITDPSFTLPPTLRYVMIELHPQLYPNHDSDSQAICQAIERCGFTLKRTVHATHLFCRQID